MKRKDAKVNAEMHQDSSSSFGVAVPKNDPDMKQAFADAQSSINTFISQLQRPTKTQDYFAIKVKVTINGQNEYIWVTNPTYNGQIFVGTLPENISALTNGPDEIREYTVNKKDIFDWMIVDGNKLIGGYTIRVARSKMTHQQRKRFDAALWFTID